MEFNCSICGKYTDEMPTCFGGDAPWQEMGVPANQFDDRVELSDDLCVVDQTTFFIPGHIELPIVGTGRSFAWSVWCSLSAESVIDANKNWNDANRVGVEYFGWLCTSLPAYDATTLHLKTDVLMRNVGTVPHIVVHEDDHPIYVEQNEGISPGRYHEIVHELLHKDGQPN